jgi:cytolysin-activating lysine-acyltransferase
MINDTTNHASRLNGHSATTSQKPVSASRSQAQEPLGITEKVQRDAASLRNAVAFTQAAGVLMRSPHYKEYKIGDLEWLLLPAITHRQFRIGEVKLDQGQGDAALPVALVLWAFVSPEVDKRLSEATDAVPQLAPEEWKSGDIPWLVHAAGETRFVRSVVDQLTATTFKNREVKVLGRDKDNNIKMHVLGGTQIAQSSDQT